jgi:hypothetical protein
MKELTQKNPDQFSQKPLARAKIFFKVLEKGTNDLNKLLCNLKFPNYMSL